MLSKSKKNRLFLFCEGTSIRGMQKVLRARTRFLRFIWIAFVLLMSSVLVITTTYLILDFLQYKTAWQVSTILDAKSIFPSITICSHNPFSSRANKLWSEGRIFSPTQYRANLTRLTEMAYRENMSLQLRYLPFYDEVRNYYAQLRPDEANRLGHSSNMIRFCMTKYTQFSTVSSTCADHDLFRVVRLSTLDFFNCWTIEPNITVNGSTDYEETESHQMILSITPSSDINEMNDNFVMDMLSRGEGIRLVIHEPGTYPDIDKYGVNLQPGKMNEISFRTKQWHRRSTPKAPCKQDQPAIVDLDRTFNYTFTQCLKTVLQKETINKCKCMNAHRPRPFFPSRDTPYCFYISDPSPDILHSFDKRVNCADQVNQRSKALKDAAEGNQCFHRCNYYSYETTMSVTEWIPSIKKLARLEETYLAYNKRPDYHEWKEKVPQILHNNDSTSNDSKYKDLFQKNGRFIFISISRKSFDVSEMTENLVLDINILVSRIGGLCSLCIGLTCAFFIELIEFFYLFFRDSTSKNNSPENNSEQFRSPVGFSSSAGAQPTACFTQPHQETAYHFTTDTPTHVMLEADSPYVYSSPWRKMNNNHELTSRRLDPSISCV